MTEIPRRLRGWTLGGHPDRAAADHVAAYLDSALWAPPMGGRGMIVSGPTGSGKTGLAVGALAWFEAKRPQVELAFVSGPDLLERLRPPADIAVMDRYREAHVLVLDDLGTERLTDWGRERLYVLVNHRWAWALPTIVTTNLGFDALAEHCGERVVSRLQDGAEVVALGGRDRRR